MKILRKIFSYLRKQYMPADRYARWVGVTVGDNCLIATKNFSTEPYLITIGDNVQVTPDVYFHTHGGSTLPDRVIRNSMFSERSESATTPT